MAETLHLGFHYVQEQAPGLNCTPERLRQHLERFAAEGWTILTCGDVAERQRTNRSLPDKLATISFDDGLKSQYTTAFPILQEYGVPATFFPVSCTLGGEAPPVIGFQILLAELGAERMEYEILPKVLHGTPYATLLNHERYDIRDAKLGEPEEMRRSKWIFNHFLPQSLKRDLIALMFDEYLGGEGAQAAFAREWFLQEDELIEMALSDMEIGAHSVSHPDFTVSGSGEIAEEVRRSHEVLNAVSPTRTFCWPFGGVFSDRIKAQVAKHYESAWNFLSAATIPEPPYGDLYDMPRINEARVRL